MRLFLISMIMLGFCLSAPAQDEHKRAFDLFKRGNYKDALVLLEESIQSHPDWWFPIVLKGQCNQKLGKCDEALRNFNDALTLEVPSGDIPRVKNYMAKCYMEQKEYKKAVQAFTELVALVPASRRFDLYFSRGQCEIQLAKAESGGKSWYSKAIVSFTEALKNETRRSDLQIEASFQKAYAQAQIGNITGGISSLEGSIAAFQDVISRNPKEQRAHEYIINLQLEIVNKSKGDAKVKAYNDSVTYMDRYLKVWPKDDEMLMKKGLALQGAKRYKEAVNVFDLLARSTPNDAEVYFSMGSCQMADKQYQAAIKSLEKAIAKGKTKDGRVYTYISSCYSKQKQKCYASDIPLEKNAIAILEKGVKGTSGDFKAALTKELDRKKNNLKILEDNLATDNNNHAATLENIRNLSTAIGKNTSILAKNNEMYVSQPTDELRSAIDNGQKSIAEDKSSLAKEYDKLAGYVKEAKKCSSDSKVLKHFNDMVGMLKARK